MKKLLILPALALFLTNMSFAAIDDNDTSNIDRLRNQGYSEHTLRVLDNVKYMNQHGNYETYYVDKDQNPFGRAYTKLKLYVDLAQDDNKFGMHQINYTNTFFGDETDYATRKVRRSEIEDL